MGAIADAFASAFRDFQTEGDPGSGIFNPLKSAIRALGLTIESNLSPEPVKGGLISGSGSALLAGRRYGASTATSPVVATLPQLSTVGPSDVVIVRDVDFNAATNNVTIDAYYGDTIMFEGSALTAATINVNGAQLELMANNGYWRASYHVG